MLQRTTSMKQFAPAVTGLVVAALVSAGCAVDAGHSPSVSSGKAASPLQATPTAGQVAYVPPSAAKTAQARFALTPHPSPTATVVPTATPSGAHVAFASVQQLLTGTCSGCHPPLQGMDLTASHVYASIVNVKSREVPSLMRVKPGDPTDSYLYQKVTQAKPMVGVRMPKGGQPLTPDEITTLRVWIEQGASER